MNVPHILAKLAPRTPATVRCADATPTHSRYRERDVGIGYGSSSGYALSKRYTSDWGSPRFRCL